MKRRVLIFCLLLSCILNVAAHGDELVEDRTSEFKTDSVVTGLNNPWGIAVRAMRSSPGTFEIYFAESGAGRVARIWTRRPEEVSTFIEGFETAPLSADSPWAVGPLGLAWVNPNKLAVTTASEKLVRVYTLPLHSEALGIADTDHVAEPSLATQRLAGTGITAVFSSGYMAYFTVNSMSPSTGILQAEIRGNHLKRITPFLSESNTAANFFATGVAATPSDRPDFVVVAREGIGRDSDGTRLSFYDPTSGALALDLEVPLRNLSALAYSPSGNLYAVDVQWEDFRQGGVYRLDDAHQDGRQVCRAIKVASVSRPIDLEFADRNTLYVSSLGEEVNEKKGSLVLITGDF